MTYAAVLFDLDGTLLDTERLAMAAGRKALRDLGHDPEDALFHRLIGTDQDTGMRLLQDALGEIDMPALFKAWQREAKALFAQGVDTMPGAFDLVQRLAQAQMPIAIATSSGRSNAMAKLEKSALAGQFETLVSRDCVTHAKPHPEPYLMAADRLGVRPETCLVFEDSTPGATSAHAAGMTVVLVPNFAPDGAAPAHFRARSLMDGAQRAGLFSQ